MKKTIITAIAVIYTAISFASPLPDINERVLKNFKATFKAAEEVKWSEHESHYSVSFLLSSVQTRVNYDKAGNIISSSRSYAPNLLPLNIYNAVTNRYAGKTLFGVTEVADDKTVLYVIKMYDDKKWYTLHADAEGNTEITEKYERADIGLLKK